MPTIKKNNIPNQFYVNLNGGQVLTFVKEEYPMGVRWLCSDDCRFYSADGQEIFPCMQIPDDGRTLFLFEEKGWANDYDGEYSDATGYDAINGFEDYINDMLARGVYIDYGDEDIMESTKKMKKSIDEDAVFDFIRNNNSCCYGEIYDYCKDIGMSDQQIDDAISNLESEGKIDFVNQMDYVVKSTKKSIPSIHDMIAQIRASNNSLVKSRVDLDIRKFTHDDFKRKRIEVLEDLTEMRDFMDENGKTAEVQEIQSWIDGLKKMWST